MIDLTEFLPAVEHRQHHILKTLRRNLQQVKYGILFKFSLAEEYA